MISRKAILTLIGVAVLGFGLALVPPKIEIKKPVLAPADRYYAQCKALYDGNIVDSAARTCSLALTINPSHFPSLKLSTRIALAQNDLVGAKTFLTLAEASNPNDPEVRFFHGKILLEENHPAEALGYLESLNTGEGLVARATALEGVGRFEDAYELFKTAPVDVSARLGAARLGEKLARPEESIGLLGDTIPEQLAKSRLLWISGRTEESSSTLESLLVRENSVEREYSKTLGLLGMVYYGLGKFPEGALVVDQFAKRESLPSILLSKIWPWVAALLVYLVVILYGESRIEPISTVELASPNRFGPGSMHIWMFLASALAAIIAGGLGYSMYHNYLSFFTPVQGAVTRPIFYLLMGFFGLLLAYRVAGREGILRALGPTHNWVEGIWVGFVLLAGLAGYGYIARQFNLGSLTALYPVFFGLAFLEIVVSGFGYTIFKERYKELANILVPFFFALSVPGPTLFFLFAAIFLGWLARRTHGAFAGAVAWIFAGLILALIGNYPLIRTLLAG